MNVSLLHVFRKWKTRNKDIEKSGQREPSDLASVLPKNQELCSEPHSPWEKEQELGVTRSENIMGQTLFLHPRGMRKLCGKLFVTAERA